MRSRVVAAAIAYAAGTAATAQPQWTQRVSLDDGSAGFHNVEIALGVNRQGADIMVAWIRFKGDDVSPSYLDSDIWYNVSTNGVTFGQPARIPRAAPHNGGPDGGDPFVSFSRTMGTGWVGGLTNRVQDRFWVCRKDPTSPTAQLATEAVFPIFDGSVDKGLLVAGPPFGGGPTALSLVFARTFYENRPCSSGLESLKRLRGLTSPDLGATWITGQQFAVGPDLPPPPNPQIQNGNRGGPGTPIILHSGPGVVGRWVVPYRPEGEYTTNPCTPPPPLLPLVTYTDDNITWVNSIGPIFARIPGSVATEQIFGVSTVFDGGHNASAGTFPSMAADPRHENDVYMVFSAQALSSGSHSDLFVAHSSDGGATFPGNQVLHLTDYVLGDPDGTEQFMSALTVDGNGSVNIVYLAASNPTDVYPPVWEYQAKYVRVPTFSTNPYPAVISFPLAGQFNLQGVTGLTPPNTNTTRFLGEYVQADSRGCDVYLGYFSRHEGGAICAYVSKVRTCPEVSIADLNADAQVNLTDAFLFAQFYAGNDPRADVNCDGNISIMDAQAFQAAYACGCTPP